MKILTRYILKEHIAPFFFAFLTITFLLIIDFIPKIIDRIIDKDLDILVVLELVALNLAWMLALSVPMSVLVATLMAFGRLSSDFEITAIKASGISLINVLIPLMIAGSILTFGMIEFHDQILPDLNKRARTLLGDIQSMRPTLVFQSGIFVTDIPGYLVLIDKIDHTTSYVQGIRITETKDPMKPRLIVADDGYLEVTNSGRNMQFTLYNGELHTLDLEDPDNYRKLDFKNQVINISGEASELRRSDSESRTDREMNIADMREQIDHFMSVINPMRERIGTKTRDQLAFALSDSAVFDSAFPTEYRPALVYVKTAASSLSLLVERNRQQIIAQERMKAKYSIEIHKKYSIPAASLAFILIGAPLGILSRRGGMGVAIAISILLFIVYWAFLIGGEDVADRGIISPFWSMWSANILLGAIGLYLNYKVLSEKPIFDWFRRKKD